MGMLAAENAVSYASLLNSRYEETAITEQLECIVETAAGVLQIRSAALI